MKKIFKEFKIHLIHYLLIHKEINRSETLNTLIFYHHVYL